MYHLAILGASSGHQGSLHVTSFGHNTIVVLLSVSLLTSLRRNWLPGILGPLTASEHLLIIIIFWRYRHKMGTHLTTSELELELEPRYLVVGFGM
jgi:hypothetical protein